MTELKTRPQLATASRYLLPTCACALGLLAALGALSGMAAAQSFDCKLARTPIEKTICATPELAKLDVAVAAKYKQKLAEVPPDVQADLRQLQRSWLRTLPPICKANAPQMSLAQCLVAQYKGQLDALDQQVMQRGGVTFVLRHTQLLAKDDADDPWKDDKGGLAENDGYGSLDASWPQALSSEPKWVAWNQAVLAETQRMAVNRDSKPVHGWDQAWAQGADATVTARLASVSAQLVSVSITNELMGHGAAHPNESYETYHWLFAQQRPLKVSDIFANPAWQAVVTARCRASLKQQIGNDYESYNSSPADFAKTLHDVVTDLSNWDLDAKGLTVSFPEYSVSPRAFPVDGVLVPWSALRPYLAPGFALPK